MRESTPPEAKTFIFPSFSRHIEKSLDLQFLIVLQKSVCGAWECRFNPNRKKRFSISLSAFLSASVQIAKSDFLSAMVF
jgi:hypothetical protein